jgi:DNA-binding transcriptional ArsR family regulator
MPKNCSFQNLTEADLGLIATRFRALSEVSRLKLTMAAGNSKKNVSQLIAATGLSQANVSKHLQILTDIGILARRKKGIYVFYSMTDSSVFKLCEVGNASLRKRLFGQVNFSTNNPCCKARGDSSRDCPGHRSKPFN